jgi:exodeoxyribonuclease VII small subunit
MAPPADGPAPAEELSFERALDRLEALVARLEGGEIALEEALAVFEEGVGLSRRCAALLEAAERRIEVLMREGDALTARPVDEGGAGAEEEG